MFVSLVLTMIVVLLVVYFFKREANESYKNKVQEIHDVLYKNYNLTEITLTCSMFVNANSGAVHIERNGKKSIDFFGKDIIKYEIFENGFNSGGSCGALIGAAFAGVAGAVVGQSVGSGTKCNSLQLRIMLNNPDNPEFVMDFIIQETYKDSKEYKMAMESINRMCSFLEYVIKNK